MIRLHSSYKTASPGFEDSIRIFHPEVFFGRGLERILKSCKLRLITLHQSQSNLLNKYKNSTRLRACLIDRNVIQILNDLNPVPRLREAPLNNSSSSCSKNVGKFVATMAELVETVEADYFESYIMIQ
ncbi:hypothetical protein M5689_020928 [Euphorbia peplus]|nr:hypothetical protein M5689_020928 [Euphorbia peplus]